MYLALILTFILGNYQGYIALWTQSGQKPDYIFPYTVASLPHADQISVEKGMQIETEEELRQLLEDYLS